MSMSSYNRSALEGARRANGQFGHWQGADNDGVDLVGQEAPRRVGLMAIGQGYEVGWREMIEADQIEAQATYLGRGEDAYGDCHVWEVQMSSAKGDTTLAYHAYDSQPTMPSTAEVLDQAVNELDAIKGAGDSFEYADAMGIHNHRFDPHDDEIEEEYDRALARARAMEELLSEERIEDYIRARETMPHRPTPDTPTQALDYHLAMADSQTRERLDRDLEYEKSWGPSSEVRDALDHLARVGVDVGSARSGSAIDRARFAFTKPREIGDANYATLVRSADAMMGGSAYARGVIEPPTADKVYAAWEGAQDVRHKRSKFARGERKRLTDPELTDQAWDAARAAAVLSGRFGHITRHTEAGLPRRVAAQWAMAAGVSDLVGQHGLRQEHLDALTPRLAQES